MKKLKVMVAVVTMVACSSALAYPTIDSTFSCPTKAQVKQKLVKMKNSLSQGGGPFGVSPIAFMPNEISGLGAFSLQEFGNYRDETVETITHEIKHLSAPHAYNVPGATLNYPLEANKAECVYNTGLMGGDIVLAPGIFSFDIKERANYKHQKNVIHLYRKGTDK